MKKYDVYFKPQAEKDIKLFPSKIKSRIIDKIEEMSDDLKGDVKHLTVMTPEFRLRMGDYRVLFEIEGNTIIIYRIVHRKDAYR